MPYELRVPLLVRKPWTPRFHDQVAMHAILPAVLAGVGADWAARIHPPDPSNDQIRPFTQVLDGGPQGMVWRITLLDDTLYDPLCDALHRHGALTIGRQRAAADADAINVRHITYTDMYESPVRQEYKFEFRTPTTFKQVNRHNPLPDPYRCFSSWWTRWNAFAPPDAAINIAIRDIVQEHVAIAKVQLDSIMAGDGPHRIVGCVGKMTFRPLRMEDLDERWSRDMAALAAFALFCGTGHKTPQGMGQTLLCD